MRKSDSLISPVVLCGGRGQRLWPLSTPQKPKQFQVIAPLKESLLETTLARFSGIYSNGYVDPLVVTHQRYQDFIPEKVKCLFEPDTRNTAAAIAYTCIYLLQQGREAPVVFVPSDHYIGNAGAFHAALAQGRALACAGQIVTLGVSPEYAATQYGYIEPDARVGGGYTVKRFIEKPDKGTARMLWAAQKYYWNSGIFLVRPDIMLEEIRQWAPEIYAAVQTPQDYERAPSVSIDYAVMEHTSRAMMIPTQMDWMDLGTWESLDQFKNRQEAQKYG